MSGSDARALSRSLLDLCRMRKLTIATAESCTGGLVAAALTDIPGSSDVIDRGFVTYSNEAKRAMLGVKAAIVVPHSAPRVKTDAIAGAGAELVWVEPNLAARVAATGRIARTRGYAEIPPFDHRLVIAGQGTIGLEIAEDLAARPPRAVLVPVAGGGLISGIAVAVTALLPETKDKPLPEE